MALFYTTGVVNQPDAGSVGLTMVEKIHGLMSLLTQDRELARGIYPASGAVRWYVLRCLAAVSGLPKDFYVIIGRTLSTGELRFVLCEDYNTGSHTASKYCQTSGSCLYDADGCSPSTYTLSTVVIPTTPPTVPKYEFWTPSGTSTKWWLIVADDGFTVAFNGASNGFVHVGQYVPLAQLPILVPLQMIANSSNQNVITRNPAVAGAYRIMTKLCRSKAAAVGVLVSMVRFSDFLVNFATTISCKTTSVRSPRSGWSFTAHPHRHRDTRLGDWEAEAPASHEQVDAGWDSRSQMPMRSKGVCGFRTCPRTDVFVIPELVRVPDG